MSKRQVAQLAKRINKKNEGHGEEAHGQQDDSALIQQYRIIRDDLVKLRDDLNRGYDMAKEAVEKKTILSELMKLKGTF